MNTIEIEWWRNRDLNPPEGRVPALELLGRKRRLEQAREIAEKQSLAIDPDPVQATTQLFNIYYDWLTNTTTDK